MSDAWFLLPSQKRNAIRQMAQFFQYLKGQLESGDQIGGSQLVHMGVAGIPTLIRHITGPDDAKDQLPAEWRRLRAICLQYGIPAAVFIDFHDGIQAIRVRRCFRDQVQFDQHVRQTVLGPGTVVRSILSGQPYGKPGPASMDLARAWATIEWMTHLAEDLRRGCLYIPLTELDGVDLSLGNLGAPESHQALATVAARLIEAQRPILAESLSILNQLPDGWAARWAVFQVRMMDERASRFLADPAAALSNPTAMTPRWRDQVRLLTHR